MSDSELSFVAYAFVDDTDLIKMAKYSMDTLEDVMANMQRAMDTWGGMIWATGGALVPEKTFWYAIEFEWEEGEWKLVENNDEDAALMMRDAKNQLQPIDCLSLDTSRRTLGVRQCPTGSNTEEYDYLVSVASEWRDEVKTSHLDQKDAWDNLTLRVMKSLEYPLLVTTFSYEECQNILQPALEAGLPASGICRNMHREIVHAPLQF